MISDIWINLSVKDIKKSVAFFTAIGFQVNKEYQGNGDSASLFIGKKPMVLMLFTEHVFKKIIQEKDLETLGKEVLFSLGVESREEIDQLAESVKKAGGIVFSEPKDEQTWMYGCGFSDLDGHKWNGLFMDFSQMPEKIK